MNFLSGMFLWALPLAAVPVVLHLYRRRQRTVIGWGAMRFLTDAARQGRRRERWEEMLLMLLRAAAVVLLVLAVSRPQLRGRWSGSHPTREVILVLDDSMSMSREIDGKTPLSELTRTAERILDELNASDVVQVITAVGGPRWLTSEAVSLHAGARHRLASQIRTLQPTNGTADLYACVHAALTVEPAAEAQARHIVVLSDGQAHGWRLDALSAWRRLQDVIAVSPLPTTIQAVTCGFPDEPVDNLAVTAIEPSTTRLGVGDEVTVRVEVRNVGAIASAATTLEMLVQGEHHEQLEVGALEPAAATTVQWTWAASSAGVFALECRLASADQLMRDNVDAAVVEVVGEIPILIVEAPAAYRQRISESEFLTAALGYQGAAPLGDWRSVFSPHLVSVDNLESTPLGEYRAIVMTDLPPLPSASVERVRQFVERGGGLWVALGRRVDRQSFNSVWYDDGGGLSPLALDEVVTSAGAGQDEAVIHPPSSERGVTAQLADTRRLDIDTVRIRTRHRFLPPSRGQELTVTLETGDGEPLVIENYLGRGRVILQALPFDVSWSNLPLTKAYVVMVHDWLDYLTEPAGTRFNLPPGGRIELNRPASASTSRATIRLPDATDKPLIVREEGDAAEYRYSQTHRPGRYELRLDDASGGTEVVPFQVTRDARESDLTALTSEQQEALSSAAGVRFRADAANLVPAVTGGRRAKPIWNRLLAVLLVLLAIELLLATRAARRRTPGTAASASLEFDGEGLLPNWTHSLRGPGR